MKVSTSIPLNLNAASCQPKTSNNRTVQSNRKPALFMRWLVALLMMVTVGTTNAQNVLVTGANAGNGSYATLQAAFAAINVAGNNGSPAIGVSIVNNTTETGTAVLDNFTWVAVNVTATVPVTVQGSIVGAIVKLNGADNVTFDGRISGSGRNITIQNNSTSGSTAVFWLASVTAANGVTNNTIRNLELACGATQNTLTVSTFGIIMNGGGTISISANGVDNDNNTFRDNRIVRCRYGIVTRGTTTNLNENVQVLNNIIGPAAFGADEIGKVGIFMQADNNSTVSGNTVQNVGGDFANTTSGADRVGVGIGQESWSMTPSTLTSTNYTVTNNTIQNIVEERTFSAVGLLLATTNGGSATNNLVANNFIINVKSNGTSGDQSVGLGISGGHTDRVVYNSIRMAGDVDPNPSAAATSNFGSGIRVANVNGTTHLNLSLRNNIVYMDLSSSSTAAARYYAISGNTAAYSFGTGGENYNDYYINPLNTQCVTGGLGSTSGNTLTTQFATLANWKLAYTVNQDANSIQADPGYISATNLHISLGSTTVNNVGTPVAGVTLDIDGDTRNVTTPDIGADEYTPLVCAGAAGGTIAPAAFSRCDGQTYTMSTTGSEVGAGVTYQWEISATGGGIGFANVSGGTGANTTSYTTATLTPGVYFYRLNVTCSNGPVTGFSNELTLTVNATPTVSVDVLTANYCNPNGSPVTINASGATTYAWLPALGLNTASGATVIATPTTTTAYTVTGTDGNGCTATATSTITASTGVSISSVTATPANICSGTNSQLQVNASTATLNQAAGLVYTATTGSFETIPSPTGVTVPTIGTADDGFETINTTGTFDFNFNGTTVNSFTMGTNGYVVINGTPALNGIPASLSSLSGFNVVHGFGRDGNINVTNAGIINHGLDGTGTKYVFEFINHATASGGAESATQTGDMQIVLWGNTSSSPGRIEIIYGSSLGTPATAGTIGVRDAAGTFRNAVNGSTTLTTTTATFPASGTMYTFERQAFTYVWTPSTFIAGQEALVNPLATAVTATTAYSVTATATNGCAASGTVTVTVDPLVALAATATSPNCANTNFSVTANKTGGGAPFNYSWNDGVGGIYPDAQTVTANLPAATYTFTCTITDACGGNVESITPAITVNGLPTVTVSPSSGTICNPGGSPVSLTAGGAVTYAWSPTTSLTPTSGSPVSANPTSSTTYTVSGTDANGCVNTATAAITVGAAISATASATPTTVCNGDNSQLNVSVVPTPGGPGAIIITEVTTFRTGTGATSPYPSYATGQDLVEISNISGSPVDISGWSLQDYASNSATAVHPGFTFPLGTIIPAGSVAVVCLGTGTNDIPNRYYNTGGANDSWFSTSVVGVALKNGSTIIDVVGRGTPFVWNAGTGVTSPADWSGNISVASAAGFVRTAPLDNNLGTDWVLSTITPASIGTFNVGYTPPPPVSIASYAWSPSTFIAGQESLQNPLATALTATTTYTVSVTTTDGCTASSNVTVTVTPTANAGSVSGTSPLCIGATATYSSTGFELGGGTGTWSSTTPSVASVNPTTGLVTALAAGTTDITFTITGGCGGTVSALQTLTVDPNANAGTVSGTTPLCIGATATYSSTGDAGGAWSSDNASVATVNPTSGLVTAVSAGSANITYTVTAGCNNPASASQSVTVSPDVNAGTVSGTSPLCIGATATYSSTGDAGGTWSSDNGSVATVNPTSGLVTAVSAGSANITYTVTGCAGPASASQSVTVDPNVNAGTVSGTSPLCIGATATYSSTGDAGGTWSSDNGSVATVNPTSGLVTAVSAGSANITYTVTGCNGPASASQSVTVDPNVNAGTVSGTTPLCIGATATYSSTGDAGGAWSSDNGSVATVNPTSGLVTAVSAGSANITYTVTGCAGPASASQSVTVDPNVNAGTVSGTSPLCIGATATYSSTGDAGGTWSSDNGSVATVNPTSGLVTAVSAGSANITYTVTGCNGPASASQSVTVDPNVNAGTVSGTTPLIVTATATYSSTGDAGGTWSSTSPSVASVNPTSGLVTALSAGTTDITYTVTGCGGPQSAFQTLTVNPNIQNPGTVTGTTPLCIGATATYSSDGDGGGTWSSTNPAVASVNPTSGLVTALSAGTTDITYTVTGPASSFQTLTVSPNVNAGTVTGTSPICVSTSTTFSSNGDAGGTWSSSNPAVATVNPTTGLVTAVSAGTSTITYTISSGCGSAVSASAPISVASGAAPTVAGPVNVCQYIGTGDPVVYTATSAGATGFTWVTPPNVTIVSGQGTATLTVNFLNGFAAQPNKQLKVTATSVCGTSPQFIYYLLAQAPGTPQPITGNTNVCPIIGTPATFTYSIPPVTGATSYVWIAQAGTTVVTNNGTSCTVSFTNGFTSSALTVQAVNGCGTSSARSISLVKVNPSTPGLIAGPTNACAFIAPGGTAATYSIAAVAGATSYTWTVPAGAIGLTGQGTTTISFTYPNLFVSGSVTVTATNGCGTSGVRSLSIQKLNPATPSVIDVIQITPCPNRVYSYTLASMPANATSVTWTAPLGSTILTGQGTISITVSYPGTAVTGFVTAQAINNCGSSTIRSSEVKLPVCPVEPRASGNSFTKGSTPAVESMKVNVFPNPTVSDFKLQVVTAGKQTIKVRMMDAQGRSFKTFEVLPYQTINVGAELKTGTYIMEVTQGNEVKVTKLIKF